MIIHKFRFTHSIDNRERYFEGSRSRDKKTLEVLRRRGREKPEEVGTEKRPWNETPSKFYSILPPRWTSTSVRCSVNRCGHELPQKTHADKKNTTSANCQIVQKSSGALIEKKERNEKKERKTLPEPRCKVFFRYQIPIAA